MVCYQNSQASNISSTVGRCTKALVLPAQNDLMSSAAIRLHSLRGTERFLLSKPNLNTKFNSSNAADRGARFHRRKQLTANATLCIVRTLKRKTDKHSEKHIWNGNVHSQS